MRDTREQALICTNCALLDYLTACLLSDNLCAVVWRVFAGPISRTACVVRVVVHREILTAVLARIAHVVGADAQRAAAERARAAKVAGHRVVAEAEVAAEQLAADQRQAPARRKDGGRELREKPL